MATAAPRVFLRTLTTLCRARAILPRSVTIAVNCRDSLMVAQPVRASLLGCRSTSLITTKRWYASDHPEITEKDIQDRTLTVVKLFDKVNPDKVTLEAHFLNDLGLDSLDAVEIVMAFEDEFGIEISDEEAEKIFTCNDAVELLKVKFDVH